MSERNKGKPVCDAQIRLLLPRKWVDELDTIAASRHLSRLGLIRGYLRSRIDHDLNKLAEHWQIQQTNDATCRKLKRVTEEREQRRKYDNWEF